RRHTRFSRDWSSDVCSSDLDTALIYVAIPGGGLDLAMPDDLVRDARAGDELEATPWDGHVDEGGVARNDFERGIGEESECPRTESGREREGRLSQRADKARPRYEPAAKEAHCSEPRTDPDERHDPDAVSTD